MPSVPWAPSPRASAASTRWRRRCRMRSPTRPACASRTCPSRRTSCSRILRTSNDRQHRHPDLRPARTVGGLRPLAGRDQQPRLEFPGLRRAATDAAKPAAAGRLGHPAALSPHRGCAPLACLERPPNAYRGRRAVQGDYVAILRFHTQANLQAWLDSPVRRKLIEEAEPLTEEFHARVGTGFEQWFRDESGAPAPWAVWKMDFIVLLLLYPIVFLWGVWVGTPILQNQMNMPWALNLFIGNIFSVALTGFMVPWVANHMGWWMNPKANVLRANLLGAVLVCAIYALSIWIFWKFF